MWKLNKLYVDEYTTMCTITYFVTIIVVGPLYVIVEYAPYGNLREFLREHRAACDGFSDDVDSQQNSSLSALSYRDLLSFAFQVARGLEYMSSQMVNIALTKIHS